jgi:hypothetical protein
MIVGQFSCKSKGNIGDGKGIASRQTSADGPREQLSGAAPWPAIGRVELAMERKYMAIGGKRVAIEEE